MLEARDEDLIERARRAAAQDAAAQGARQYIGGA
jgi:hypothetical protein